MRGRDAIAAWQRLTFGWMGRSPDYKAAFLATYGPNADYYKPFEENARRWYKDSQEQVIFHNHTLVNPPVDRNKEIHEVADMFIHAVKETDAGVVVSGAKMVATGAALSNYNFVSYHGSAAIKQKEYAISFFAAMNQPGMKLICRPSYEFMAATVGTPFDYPLSSRFDENDAVLVFEDALIPWENFLIYGNIEIASTYHLTGFIWRALFQGCTRLAVKLDFLAGLFIKMVEATGHVRVPRHPGIDRRDPRLAQHVLGAHGRHVPQPRPVGRGHGAAEHRGRVRLSHPLEPGLSGDQVDHREPDRRRADRAAVEHARLEVDRAAAPARPASTAARTATTRSRRSSSSSSAGMRSAASSAAATSSTSAPTPAATS